MIHNQLLSLAHIEGQVVVLTPHCQVSDLCPIGCLIIVVSKLNDGVGVVLGHAVLGEQGLQEGIKYTPLRGRSVEDQLGRCVVAYPYHLGAGCQKVQNPVVEGRCLAPGSLA
jgi:hypothetical protein